MVMNGAHRTLADNKVTAAFRNYRLSMDLIASCYPGQYGPVRRALRTDGRHGNQNGRLESRPCDDSGEGPTTAATAWRSVPRSFDFS
jgi:hypothetical protein